MAVLKTIDDLRRENTQLHEELVRCRLPSIPALFSTPSPFGSKSAPSMSPGRTRRRSSLSASSSDLSAILLGRTASMSVGGIADELETLDGLQGIR